MHLGENGLQYYGVFIGFGQGVLQVEEKKIKLIFRRGSLLLKIAVLAMVVLSAAALLTIWIHKEQAKKDRDELRTQAIVEEQKKSRLEDAISKVGTLQGIFQVAREELGLVDPNTVIIEPAQ